MGSVAEATADWLEATNDLLDAIDSDSDREKVSRRINGVYDELLGVVGAERMGEVKARRDGEA